MSRTNNGIQGPTKQTSWSPLRTCAIGSGVDPFYGALASLYTFQTQVIQVQPGHKRQAHNELGACVQVGLVFLTVPSQPGPSDEVTWLSFAVYIHPCVAETGRWQKPRRNVTDLVKKRLMLQEESICPEEATRKVSSAATDASSWATARSPHAQGCRMVLRGWQGWQDGSPTVGWAAARQHPQKLHGNMSRKITWQTLPWSLQIFHHSMRRWLSPHGFGWYLTTPLWSSGWWIGKKRTMMTMTSRD